MLGAIDQFVSFGTPPQAYTLPFYIAPCIVRGRRKGEETFCSEQGIQSLMNFIRWRFRATARSSHDYLIIQTVLVNNSSTSFLHTEVPSGAYSLQVGTLSQSTYLSALTMCQIRDPRPGYVSS